MPMLNLPPNGMYPPLFVRALAKADEARRVVGNEGDVIGTSQLRAAVHLLAESNELLVKVLTDGNVK
jgi:hypothetical protein